MVQANLDGKPYILDYCTGCGYCFLQCRHNAVEKKAAQYQINSSYCTNCGKCIHSCPVSAIKSPDLEHRYLEHGYPQQGINKSYDAIIIGSGIGGLLCAVVLAKKGKKIAIIESLNFLGGRFTQVKYKGIAVQTGACHTLPYGKRGPFAELLRFLKVPVKIIDSDGMGSLFVSGKQHSWKNLVDLFRPFPMQDRLSLLRVILKLLYWGNDEYSNLSFANWLRSQGASCAVRLFFDRMLSFGCSMSSCDISFQEAVKVIKNTFRAKSPGFIEGGCGFLINQLVAQIRESKGSIYKETEAVKIMRSNNKVDGVIVENRNSGSRVILKSKLVISDIGPDETNSLLGNSEKPVYAGPGLHNFKAELTGSASNGDHQAAQREAYLISLKPSGLCINMICDKPLLTSGFIMYCLDTKRVAGIAQPTRVDPSLAPQGKHILISYQLLEGNNLNREINLGLKDLEHIFGNDFLNHCSFINTGVFKSGWPVNRAAQGRDCSMFEPVKGLYMVGDGCKASGYVMVEGIARQVLMIKDQLS